MTAPASRLGRSGPSHSPGQVQDGPDFPVSGLAKPDRTLSHPISSRELKLRPAVFLYLNVTPESSHPAAMSLLYCPTFVLPIPSLLQPRTTLPFPLILSFFLPFPTSSARLYATLSCNPIPSLPSFSQLYLTLSYRTLSLSLPSLSISFYLLSSSPLPSLPFPAFNPFLNTYSERKARYYKEKRRFIKRRKCGSTDNKDH